MASLTTDQQQLVERAGDLKRALVQFATSPPLQRQLRVITRRHQLESTDLPEYDVLVNSIEELLFDFTFDDGSTVLDRFGALPARTDKDGALLVGLGQGRTGIYEIRTLEGDVMEVVSALDDLSHVLVATQPGVVGHLEPGDFIHGRILPVADVWVLSGNHEIFPAAARAAVADAVRVTVTLAPALTFTNPDLRRRAEEVAAATHDSFVTLFGTDAVVRSAADVADTYAAALGGVPMLAEVTRQVAADALSGLEVGASQHVGIVSHRQVGITFCLDYGAVADALADPETIARPERAELVLGYLEDETIAPWIVDRLVTRAQPEADAALASLLRRPGFDWDRDGAGLLVEYKPSYEGLGLAPVIATLPSLAAQARS